MKFHLKEKGPSYNAKKNTGCYLAIKVLICTAIAGHNDRYFNIFQGLIKREALVHIISICNWIVITIILFSFRLKEYAS